MIVSENKGCIKCGLCVSACPVVELEGLESFTGPRNIAVECARFGMETEHVRDSIMKCTTCWKCGQVCPSQILLPEIILAMRTSIFSEGKMLPGHRRITENIDRFRRAITPSEVLPLSPVRTKAEYLYFPGCISESRTKPIMEATVAILSKTKAEFGIPPHWSCCGAPLEKIGDSERMRILRDENLVFFEPFDRIVTSCPGCTTQLISNYGMEPMHTIEYLYEVVGVNRLSRTGSRPKVKVALHQPCHLNRTVGPHVIEEAAQILQSLQGVKLVEMEDPDRCCGGGGGVVAGNPEVAMSLAKAKVRDAREARADLIIAPCPFCVMNINRVGDIEATDFTVFLNSYLSKDG
jgi:fumarate reductase (CoM/CoB) subunit B